jgi:hypothetical protein
VGGYGMMELTILQTVIKKLLEAQGIEAAAEIIKKTFPGYALRKIRKDFGTTKKERERND